jgi:hypothetical protein
LKRALREKNLAPQRRKEEEKKEEKTVLLRKNGIIPLAFVLLCVLRVFAVQGFPSCNTLLRKGDRETGYSFP